MVGWSKICGLGSIEIGSHGSSSTVFHSKTVIRLSRVAIGPPSRHQQTTGKLHLPI